MKQNTRLEEGKALRQCLKESQAALRIAQAGFDMANEPELVDAYIYEIHALQAKNTYLLRRIKELEREQGQEKQRRILQWI